MQAAAQRREGTTRSKRYEIIEKRNLIWLSLNTDSMSAATAKAEIAWQEQVEAWEAKLAGADEDADKHFDAARRLAASRPANLARRQDPLHRDLHEAPVRNAG